ncbi:hypothetical protein GOODEAATRI_034291 [Goodea atripinnis]|uniref:Uncharacterized protein n=1 Tax=Goodea atripinnis TaxID=208336 RepID=A0ABV0PUF5_9TELE
MNTGVIKILAIPIISIRTDHLPYSCIVTLKWNVLSSGTESKLFFCFCFLFSEKTNHKQNVKILLPLLSGFCASSCPVTSLLQVGDRWKPLMAGGSEPGCCSGGVPRNTLQCSIDPGNMLCYLDSGVGD